MFWVFIYPYIIAPPLERPTIVCIVILLPNAKLYTWPFLNQASYLFMANMNFTSEYEYIKMTKTKNKCFLPKHYTWKSPSMRKTRSQNKFQDLYQYAD